MLAAVLLSLAVGARLVPWLRQRGYSAARLLAAAGEWATLVLFDAQSGENIGPHGELTEERN